MSSKLKSCVLCGTKTSGNDDPRFYTYLDKLIKSATIARDEKALVWVAEDMLSSLNCGVGSSSRVLPHEEDVESKIMFTRYHMPEKALINVRLALDALQAVEKSLLQHLEEEILYETK